MVANLAGREVRESLGSPEQEVFLGTILKSAKRPSLAQTASCRRLPISVRMGQASMLAVPDPY
jgi:hypothetical protein